MRHGLGGSSSGGISCAKGKRAVEMCAALQRVSFLPPDQPLLGLTQASIGLQPLPLPLPLPPPS
jgi:hypothetical protein